MTIDELSIAAEKLGGRFFTNEIPGLGTNAILIAPPQPPCPQVPGPARCATTTFLDLSPPAADSSRPSSATAMRYSLKVLFPCSLTQR